MAKDSILKVVESEEKVKEIELLAKEEKDKILKTAQQEAGRIIADAEASSDEIMKLAKQKADTEIYDLLARAEVKGNAQAEKLRKKAESNFDKAVELVIENLVG